MNYRDKWIKISDYPQFLDEADEPKFLRENPSLIIETKDLPDFDLPDYMEDTNPDLTKDDTHYMPLVALSRVTGHRFKYYPGANGKLTDANLWAHRANQRLSSIANTNFRNS